MKINWNPKLKTSHVVTTLTVVIMICSAAIISSPEIENYMLQKSREKSRMMQQENSQQKTEVSKKIEDSKRVAELRKQTEIRKKEIEEEKRINLEKTVKKAVAEEEVKSVQLVDVKWNDEVEERQFEEEINLYNGKSVEKIEGKIYSVGKIKSGNYKDRDIFLFFRSGMAAEAVHFMLEDGGNAISLQAKGIELDGIDNLPDSIITPNSQIVLLKNYSSSVFFKDLKIERKVLTDNFGRDYYQTEENCIVTKLPNQTALAYNIQIPFKSSNNGEPMKLYFGEERSLDDYTNGYVHRCGGICSSLKIAELDKDDLIYTGRANSGDKIYELKDKEHQKLKSLYEDKNTIAYVNSDHKNENGSKYTYQEFLALRPLIYWKDPFGNWVEFMNTKLASAAEMCKPVVYLYPEKKTDIQVKVFPNGGFTYADPEYGDGWMVETNPNGKIVDLKTGKKYDYLFWEGIGINLKEMDEGWIVENSKIDEFLEAKLTTLGLNKKERSDFKEYWVERLSEEGFYKISFVEQLIFDEIAPFEIFPTEPKNIIRVFMLAKKVSGSEVVNEQTLPNTTHRDGFTVVEWGGSLLK